jgi:hypothetical protein
MVGGGDWRLEIGGTDANRSFSFLFSKKEC